MNRCLQQEMSTLILRWDVCKTVLSMWVGACNRVCLYWFWDGTFTRQFTLYKYTGICSWVRLHWFWDGIFTRQLDLYEASATWNVYTDSKMFTRQSDLFVQYERQLQPEMSTSILRWDVHKTVWAVWKASAKGNVYLDSEMGRLQDTLICTRGICNRKCLHWFWHGTFTRQFDLYQCMRGICTRKWIHRFQDGMFTRQFDLYKRHLQQEMSTSIPRWDVYKTVWSVREASATWTGSITEWCGVFMIRHFSRASFICTSRYLQYEMATFIPRWDLYKGVWFEQLRWAI